MDTLTQRCVCFVPAALTLFSTLVNALNVYTLVTLRCVCFVSAALTSFGTLVQSLNVDTLAQRCYSAVCLFFAGGADPGSPRAAVRSSVHTQSRADPRFPPRRDRVRGIAPVFVNADFFSVL